MKNNRILSTAGVCPKNSMKLRSYCNLMQGSLTDKWLFADDFVESHVCIILDKYMENIDNNQINMSQVIIVINQSNQPLDCKYQISLPLNAAKIKDVLNRISREVQFKPITLNRIEKQSSVNKFKSAFTRIRKNLFGKRGRKMIELKQSNREQFISRITQKITPNSTPSIKVVLLGSPGSGKTTAIQSASNGKALNSDVSATDSVASNKVKTTVGIDYAEIMIPDDLQVLNKKITLIGTPGQIKFNFIWDVVGKSANAFIILLDMSRPEPLSYLKFYQKFLHNELGKTSQIYCALTHADKYQGDINTFMDCVESEFVRIKGVYCIDARNNEDMTILLTDIYPQIVAHTNKTLETKNHLSLYKNQQG